MERFVMRLQVPSIRYVRRLDDDGNVVGSDPVAVLQLRSDAESDLDPHELCENLRDKVGKRMVVDLTLEQAELFPEKPAADQKPSGKGKGKERKPEILSGKIGE